jgi:hypothetical protein
VRPELIGTHFFSPDRAISHSEVWTAFVSAGDAVLEWAAQLFDQATGLM